MELRFKKKLSTMTTVFDDGESLDWSTGFWSRAGAAVNSTIFDNVNEILSGLTAEKKTQLEGIYKEAHNLLEERPTDTKDTTKKLKGLLEKIVDIVSVEYFESACLTPGHLNLTIGVKEELSPKDSAELTYFTKDYNNLLVMGELLKLAMPIIGGFEENFKELVGPSRIHVKTAEILYVPQVVDSDAFRRLQEYVSTFVTKRITSTGSGILDGVGTEQAGSLLLSTVLIKKIIPFNGRADTAHLVTNVFHTVNQLCDTFNKNNPRPKNTVGSDDPDRMTADKFKIVSEVPDGAKEALVYYLVTNSVRLAKKIDRRVTKKLYEETLVSLEEVDITETHITVISALCCDEINIAGLQHIPRGPRVAALAITLSVLTVRDCHAIVAFLTAEPEPRELGVLGDVSAAFTPMTVATADRLNAIYEYGDGKTPGMVFIEGVLKKFSRNRWESVDATHFKTLAEELALMLIHVQENYDEPS